MLFVFVSFLSGILTILAPCILPLLPVIVGGSLTENSSHRTSVIISSLVISVILFTLLLKWSTAFIGIPPEVWSYISGGIIFVFALTLIFPGLWERIPFIQSIYLRSNIALGAGYQRQGILGDILMGAALGPVFSSCSPTYFVILATVLPASFGLGLLYLVCYALGLGLALFVVARLGQAIAVRLGALSDPTGWFKRCIGILFLLVAILIVTGYDKQLSIKTLDSGFLDITKVETKILQKFEDTTSSGIDASSEKSKNSTGANSSKPSKTVTTKSVSKSNRYVELVKPTGYINTGGKPIKLSELVGEKIILVDFMTYSCINCIRTFPYLNDWYRKYETKGLEIIGIHTPEFAFEKDITNVAEAMRKFDVRFPIALDNNYSTWRAYKNNYWPRKYLIDINGNIVYDHIGEGKYQETEDKIVQLLNERARKLKTQPVEKSSLRTIDMSALAPTPQSPETYLGGYRGEGSYTGSKGTSCTHGSCEFTTSGKLPLHRYAVTGNWEVKPHYLRLLGKSGSVSHHFKASKVHFVADVAGAPVSATVYIDGAMVRPDIAGTDVDEFGRVIFDEAKLYTLVDLHGKTGDHVITIEFDTPDVRIYTFTFS